MSNLSGEIAGLAEETGFVGVVSVSTGEDVAYEGGFGAAVRAQNVPWTPGTVFATASATKGFTAAAVLSLVDDGLLPLDAAARQWLGDDLPLISAEVTVGHLLGHRSGIGDYADDDAAEEVPLQVPVQALDSTPAYLPALDGFAPKFPAGTRFAYCNGGYVVLALIAERAARVPFAELVRQRVFEAAGMADSAFLRSDALPGRVAVGYLDDGRTNIFALPVVGSGDGGAYTSVGDVRRFWTALVAGRIIARPERMTTPSSTETGHRFAYGYGLWLERGAPLAMLEGCDHGASLRSMHDLSTGRTVTVASNTMFGAFELAERLRPLLLDAL